MTKTQLTELLQTEIPLCKFMQLTIESVSETEIRALAPLSPNRNMHQTAFAGSLYALAVATGWALVQYRMNQDHLEGLLVVKNATIHYRRPVTGDIHLQAALTIPSDEPLLSRMQDGKLSVPVQIDILSKGKRCGHLDADYAIVVNR